MAGIMFQDITTLLLNPKAFKDTIDLFVERYKGKNISVVAGKKNKKQNSQERVKDPISAFILFFFLSKFSFCLRCN
jgi:hypothetical protein